MYWDNILGGFILVVYSYTKLARFVPAGDSANQLEMG